MKISIAIPTYEMNGKGREFLDFSFKRIYAQIFKDFNIVISDHSRDYSIERLCEEWMGRLSIRYFRNLQKYGSSSSNLNNAIQNCDGEYIKILFQDDFLTDPTALLQTSRFLDLNKDCEWIASACCHTFDGVNLFNYKQPKWNQFIRFGNNTISSPSVITIKNNWGSNILFDDYLIWLMDVDFYHRMWLKYGEPKYLFFPTVCNRIWGGSVSNTISEEVKRGEERLAREKY